MAIQQYEWTGQSRSRYIYFVYDIPMKPFDAPANYIFTRWDRKTQTWYPLYIGETDNLTQRFNNHEKWPCAQQHGVTHIHVHNKSTSQLDRRLEKDDLIAHWNPPCNDQ